VGLDKNCRCNSAAGQAGSRVLARNGEFVRRYKKETERSPSGKVPKLFMSGQRRLEPCGWVERRSQNSRLRPPTAWRSTFQLRSGAQRKRLKIRAANQPQASTLQIPLTTPSYPRWSLAKGEKDVCRCLSGGGRSAHSSIRLDEVAIKRGDGQARMSTAQPTAAAWDKRATPDTSCLRCCANLVSRSDHVIAHVSGYEESFDSETEKKCWFFLFRAVVLTLQMACLTLFVAWDTPSFLSLSESGSTHVISTRKPILGIIRQSNGPNTTRKLESRRRKR
jgi:hypothetical protein